MGLTQGCALFWTPAGQGEAPGSPVDNVDGVQVAQGTGDFSRVESGSVLRKGTLPLQVKEQLEPCKEETRTLHTRVRFMACDY